MNNIIKKIKSGQAEILQTGSIISYDSSPITIEFGDNNTNLALNIEFKNTEDGKALIETGDVVNNSLQLILSNFNNQLGSGSIKPIAIGTWDNMTLSFSFRVYTLNGSDQKTLYFTFYKHD